jgi:hypothetical protein
VFVNVDGAGKLGNADNEPHALNILLAVVILVIIDISTDVKS